MVWGLVLELEQSKCSCSREILAGTNGPGQPTQVSREHSHHPVLGMLLFGVGILEYRNAVCFSFGYVEGVPSL